MALLPSRFGTARTLLPLIPKELLRRFNVAERHDDRLKSATRLLHALWLREQGIPIGVHVGRNGRARKLGSRLSPTAAKAGRNFVTQELAELAQRVIAYQEPGAFITPERVNANALSSTAACISFMGSLRDLDLAARVLRQLLPDQDIAEVTAIVFEHSPQRGAAWLTCDRTAFDCAVAFIRKPRSRHRRREGILAMEWKLTESGYESAPVPPGRYDDLAESSGLYKDPHNAALRVNPLQQLFREHLLAQSAVQEAIWPSAVFVTVAPHANTRIQRHADLYRAFLKPTVEGQVPYQHLTLEAFIQALEQAGATDIAHRLFDRYCNWHKVDRAVAEALQQRTASWATRTKPAPANDLRQLTTVAA